MRKLKLLFEELILELTAVEIKDKFYPKMSDDIFYKIVKSDPKTKVKNNEVKMYILLKETRSWNDEFDTESFIAMPKDKFEKYRVATNNILNTIDNNVIKQSFGTNQEHIIESKENYWNKIDISIINEEQLSIIKNLFGYPNDDIVRFGTNPFFFPLDSY